MGLKAYFTAMAASGLAVLGLAAGINYTVDPAHLFGGGTFERGIAGALLAGQHVGGFSNCDERLLQRHYVAGLQAPREVLVLGSSRAMLIGSRHFPGRTVFNHGVSGATLEDLLGIYEMHLARGFRPREVVLGLDPWMLNPTHGETRWRTLAPEAGQMARRLGLPAAAESGPPRALQLISLDYLRASLTAIARPGQPRTWVAFQGTPPDEYVKFSDGALRYDRTYRDRPTARVVAAAQAFGTANPVYLLGGFERLGTAETTKLERFVALLAQQDVRLSFFLAPYHPEAYRLMQASGRYGAVAEAERHYRRLATRLKARVIGTYDPAAIAAGPGDFYDGMHPDEALTDRLMASAGP